MNMTSKHPVYHIQVRGQLDTGWSEWLGGMTITPLESGNTLLSGSIHDQTALHGLLARIRDLNLELVSINKTE